MAQLRVRLEWLTGLRRPIFRNVRLMGSWDGDGRYSHQWRTAAMQEFTAPDGCPAWRADILLDEAQRGWTFHWGVVVDSPQQNRNGRSERTRAALQLCAPRRRAGRALLAHPLPAAGR